MRAQPMRATGSMLIATLLLAAASLVVAFAIKDRCTTHNWDGYQYRTSCYNDIFALYSFRDFDERRFPYLHGDGDLDTEGDGDLEYPVVTGYFMGLVAQAARNGQEFFRLTALGLALFALAAAAMMVALAREKRRIAAFALAPALMLYAFHNWDLIAVALMCAGLVAYRARSDALAGAWLGAGAAAKVFPGLIIPALMLARRRETGRAPLRMLAAAAGTFLALNLPVLIANPKGWLVPWKFQATRFPNFETSWYFVFRHGKNLFGGFWAGTYPRLSGILSALLFAVGATLLLRAESKRAQFRPYIVSFQILLMFLLTSKVYSPQFALWLLPFFVLVRMPWFAYAAFAITDVAVWFAVSAFFLASPPLSAGDVGLRENILELAVWVRYGALAWLIWRAGHVEENVADTAREERSPAPANFSS